MSALEIPTMLWESPGPSACGVEAIRPAEFQSTDSCRAASSPSSLEYSLREACLPELNARLRAEGFEPPGKALAVWVRLARVVQVDSASITVDELLEEACAWAERVRVTERIRMRMGGSPEVDEPRRGQRRAWKPRQNMQLTFDGNKVWENWGWGWMLIAGGICFISTGGMAVGSGTTMRPRDPARVAGQFGSWVGERAGDAVRGRGSGGLATTLAGILILGDDCRSDQDADVAAAEGD